ncbi:hypothetical protein [Nostoc phage A1]|nr:hypothetical protein [Nostoc phage A1]
MVKNGFQALWEMFSGGDDDSDSYYDPANYPNSQMPGETSAEFQARMTEKAENDAHSRKRTNAQLNDPQHGLTQANLEQAKREGLISEEQYKKGLSDLRKKKWEETGIDKVLEEKSKKKVKENIN